MATVEELKLAKAKVKEEFLERVKENPDIGLHEFAKQELESMGIDTSEFKTFKELANRVSKLSFSQKRKFGKDFKIYESDYKKAIEDLKKGTHRSILELPKKAIEAIVKGAGIGTSVAGIVNTMAPNLFPVAMGYAAAAIPTDTLVKLGLVSIGAFSTPVISQGAVLGVGAVAGATIYTAGKITSGAIKGVHNKIKEHKEKNDAER